MGFRVTARRGEKEYTHHYNLLVGAFDMALSVAFSGMSDIRISDDAGRT